MSFLIAGVAFMKQFKLFLVFFCIFSQQGCSYSSGSINLTLVQYLECIFFPNRCVFNTGFAANEAQTQYNLNRIAVAAIQRLPTDGDQTPALKMAHRPFHEVAPVFKNWLDDKYRGPAAKATITEALAEADRDALPFLLHTAARHTSAEVRAAAAWAIGEHADTGDLGIRLNRLISVENNTQVRRRLYDALMQQSTMPVEQVLDRVLLETDAATRIAGFNAVAMGMRRSDTAEDVRFARIAVPELTAMALAEGSQYLRTRAVFALIRSGLPEAALALASIEQNTDEPIKGMAHRGLSHAVISTASAQ